MSYDSMLLYERISLTLGRSPSISLGELSRKSHVSPRTVQNTVMAVTGKKLRDLRNEFLLAGFRNALLSEPAATIKELSSQIGYRSSRAFARAIRRACGVRPEELRAMIGRKLVSSTMLPSGRSVCVASPKYSKMGCFCGICPFSALALQSESSYSPPRSGFTRKL